MVAFITTVPGAFAVIFPSESTVAILLLPEVKLTVTLPIALWLVGSSRELTHSSVIGSLILILLLVFPSDRYRYIYVLFYYFYQVFTTTFFLNISNSFVNELIILQNEIP